jgi:hypothetical protein
MRTLRRSQMLIDTAAAMAVGTGLFLPGAVASGGDVQLIDTFDTLDPAWQVDLTNVSDWSFANRRGNLVVNDIDSTVVDTGGGGQWAIVTLTRPVEALGDFQFDAEFAWDSEGSAKAMQVVDVLLLGGCGEETVVAHAGMHDAWVGHTGSIVASVIGAPGVSTGFDTQPGTGSTSVEIVRTGETTTIWWNGAAIVEAPTSIAVTAVRLEFWFYNYTGPSGPSFLGSLSFDELTIEGAAGAGEFAGDLNGDCVVDGADLGLLLSAWGSSDEAADLNGDRTVDGADLGLLLGSWTV